MTLGRTKFREAALRRPTTYPLVRHHLVFGQINRHLVEPRLRDAVLPDEVKSDSQLLLVNADAQIPITAIVVLLQDQTLCVDRRLPIEIMDVRSEMGFVSRRPALGTHE